MNVLLLLCALIGYWFGGGVGLLLGLGIGVVLRGVTRNAALQAQQAVQSRFLDTTFAVMGAVCKADGVVTPDEIRVTEEIFVRLGLSPELRDAAKEAFRRGKSPEFDLDAAVDAFAHAARGATALHQLFLQIQLSAVAADGKVHPAERELLVHVARRLGLGEIDIARLEALLRGAASGAASPGAARPGSGSVRPPPQQRIDDAYAALGVTPQASESELKSAYRKLMRDNHPDRLTAKGLPEHMRALAEERAREINVAYDVIKQARGFS
jgi:DnaJ like chaperone protein